VTTTDGVTPEHVFSEHELLRYNGEKGRPVYVAYGGLVYDVTGSARWRTGMHERMHFAGLDLTRALRKAPHGLEVFRRWPVVGRLEVS